MGEQKLDEVLEAVLVKYAKKLDDCGIPPRRKFLLAQAERLGRMHTRKADFFLGVSWMTRFLKRHPSLQVKRPSTLEKVRKKAATAEVMKRHIRLYEKTVKRFNVKEENIWNMDEKGFLTGHVSKIRVICKRGRGPPISQVDGSREFMTVLEAVPATGKTIPSCIVWKGKYHLMGKYIPGAGRAGTRYACTPNGWTCRELAQEWLERHFEPSTRSR